ncbi:hypothetical protein OKW21_001280 [Catalinimonas alkaloidigena]|uniref:hypothetical protein n=1 Tax=Catalinimonas alkaloidigena TaxID=1075417 RepID=UPI002405704A|nr:hypothetical protein [Catalinimonas alkaloidigena]MDF9796017.1 hypothetical protein [Catalinimonas alkaloidigena]
MQTERYNPSHLEIQVANAIESLKGQIEEQLEQNKIIELKNNTDLDNPQLNIYLQDKDGDQHEIVIKVIQRIDNLQNE